MRLVPFFTFADSNEVKVSSMRFQSGCSSNKKDHVTFVTKTVTHGKVQGTLYFRQLSDRFRVIRIFHVLLEILTYLIKQLF